MCVGEKEHGRGIVKQSVRLVGLPLHIHISFSFFFIYISVMRSSGDFPQ